MGGVEYQVTKVDPTNPETKGMVYQVHKVSEEVAATLGGKVYRARIIKDPTEPTVAGKVYQIVLIDDPDDPSVKGKVYNAILTGGSEAVVVGPAVSPLALDDAVAGPLSYVKAFGGTEQNGTPTPDVPVDIVSNNGTLVFRDTELPVGYRRLKDIIFNGETYYVTDIYLTGADTTTFTINATENGRNVLGSYTGSGTGNNLSFYLSTGSTGNYVRYKDGLYRPVLANEKLNTDLTLSIGPTGTTGFDTDATWTELEFVSPDLFYIGWLANASSPKFKGSFKGNITISNRATLIPCERTSDGAIGYYNIDDNVFFENQGTGTPTTSGYDYDYCDLMVDGTVETIGIYGNNLIDLSAVTDGYYYDPQGNYTSLSAARLTDYIPIKAGKDVKIYFKSLSTTATLNVRINIFNSSKVWQSQEVLPLDPLADGTRTITPTDNGYIRISGNYSGGAIVDWSTASVTESLGSATAEMLLKVGDYQDVQSIIDGVVTRNVGVKVLDGTENWNYNNIRFSMILSGAPESNNNIAVCSHYKNVIGTTPVADMSNQTFKLNNLNRQLIFKDSSFTTLSAWTTFLAAQCAAGTPVIILYPLATATTESVTGQTLQVTAGDNTLEITQASLDGLQLEAEYEKEA